MPALIALVLACATPAAAATTSPAEQRIAQARQAIAANPDRPEAHNQLALALARRARETGDPNYYRKAEEVLQETLRLQPNDFEAQKIRAWILLGRHEFAKALEAARELNRQAPDDVLVYGLLTDAYVELGRYSEAEESAQWMLDIRPGQVPALTRASYLRELFGDPEGAVELMESAYQRTPPTEVEDRAWILTQLGHLRTGQGQLDVAEKLLADALVIFPRYHYALGALARVRALEGRTAEAVSLAQQRYEVAPHPENLYELADALERAGRRDDARRAWTHFETRARQESSLADNANHELVFYYVDRAHRPADGLALAQLEAGRRQDLRTLEAQAWALSATGRHREAQAVMARALAPGLKEAGLEFHAGVVALRAGDRATARRHLVACLDMAPMPDIAAKARQELRHLGGTAAR